MECYDQGNYPKVHCRADFDMCSLDSILSDQTKEMAQKALNDPREPAQWTTPQTLKLLEAIAEKGEQWELVAAAVGRSKEDCLSHFIRMPICENIVHKFTETSNAMAVRTHPSTDVSEASVFGDVSNPILSQVALFGKLLHVYKAQPQVEEEQFGVGRRASRRKPSVEAAKEEPEEAIEEQLLDRDTCIKIKQKSEA